MTSTTRTRFTFKNMSPMAASQCILILAAVACLAAEAFPQQHQFESTRQRAVFARRAADDSRPVSRVATTTNKQQVEPSSSSSSSSSAAAAAAAAAVVMGRFRAPAPEQMQQQRLPKKSQFVSQTVAASFRVADDNSQPEKIVHGLPGASVGASNRQKTVGAKIQVSDEGLNYPPSKLSADIYGNVAEIVTAPPEAVEDDFLIPSSRFY